MGWEHTHNRGQRRRRRVWAFVILTSSSRAASSLHLPHFPCRLLRIKGFGVELIAQPFHDLLVLRMLGITNRFHEVFISPRPATIFWWASPGSCHANRIFNARCRLE